MSVGSAFIAAISEILGKTGTTSGTEVVDMD
jgi:hypothetical protein